MRNNSGALGKPRPLVIAHRGYSGKFPENTLAAFQGAIETGADMIELDVHLTRDGALLVTHDFELGRTGGDGTISTHTSAELRRFDAGSWFGPGFRGERFPVLGEVLALAKGKIELNIELKEETLTSPEAYEAMAEKTLVLARGHAMLDHIVISSFDWKALKYVRERDQKVRLGLLNHEPEVSLRWQEMGGIHPYSYHPNHEKLTNAHASEIRGHGLKLFPYTANTEAEFAKLRNLGADGVITNEVEALMGFLDK
jgi:glycerophosphoryl diester phosphodiesterase